MVFSSLTPISKWEIVGYMIHMKLMGCMSVEKGCVEEEMRQTDEKEVRPIGSGKAARPDLIGRGLILTRLAPKTRFL